MDTSLLTESKFWENIQPIKGFPELIDHVLFDTSGSSGFPKSIAISKKALLASAAAVNRRLEVNQKSCWGLALPINHVGGFGVAARAYQANCGFKKYLHRWDVHNFHQWLSHYKITHCSLVPTQIHDLVKAHITAPATLLAAVVGGGHLDIITGQSARNLGWPVLASYGMTEAASQIATQRLDQLDMPYQPTSLPLLPIWEARLTSEKILEIAGPALFSGYILKGKFIHREQDWYTTSDHVVIDHNTISPIGRSDTQVKILGELVDPEIIEREIFELSKGKLTIGTFAVIAIPDKRNGNSLIAIFESLVNPELIDRVLSDYNKQALGFKKLKNHTIVNFLPRNKLGKLQRNKLIYS